MRKRLPLKYQILMIALLIFIPILVAFQLYVRQFVNRVNEQMAGELSSSLSVYLKAMQKEFTDADAFLFRQVWDSECFVGLQNQPSGQLRAQYLEQLREMSEEFLEGTTSISGVLFYSKEQGVRQISISGTSAYSLAGKDEIVSALQQLADQGAVNNLGWTTLQVNERSIVVRIATRGSLHCICIADLTSMKRNARRDYNMSTSMLFLQGDTPLTTALWVEQYAGGEVHVKDGYCILRNRQSSHLVVLDHFLNFKVLYGAAYRDSEWITVSTIVYVLVILLTFLIAWVAVRSSVLTPMRKLEQVMQRIRDGNPEERSNDFRSTEFAHVNETFNQMIGAINQLKIDSYERQLHSKRLEMDALRLQIRPHFYLNCLKNLYGLSQMDNQPALQQSILYLSEHLRYTFDLKRDCVSLQDELEMCGNYMQLLGIGQPSPPELALLVEANVMEFVVPPISVLTLVENCFKHGAKIQQQLRVSITARQFIIDNSRVISLCVADNGPGFPEDVLELLNHHLDTALKEACVGLRNVVRRFQLLYGDGFSIAFFNRNGAVIEMMIQQKEGDNSETAHC